MRQLTDFDATFLARDNPRTGSHITMLAVVDPSTAPGGELTLDALHAHVESRLHLVPPFRWRLAEVPLSLDHPYWVEDPAFDLDYHLRELALPAPGDDEQLKEQAARLAARPLDRVRPLWEMYLVQGVSGDRAALIVKVHHALVDGVSGIELMSALLDLEPAGRDVPPPPRAARPAPMPTQREMLTVGLRGMLTRPRRSVEATLRLLATIEALPAVLGPSAMPRPVARLAARVQRRDGPAVLEATVDVVPKTPFNARVGHHRRLGLASVALDDIKEVKNAFGTTVNDVVVALASGGLRRWLMARKALPQTPLVAGIPVSVRAEGEEYGNRISSMIIAIPTDERDAVRRLRRTHTALRAAKERHRALPASTLQDAASILPPALAAGAARLLTAVMTAGAAPPVNTSISNIPGPQSPLYCAGAKLVALHPLAPLVDGCGLTVTVTSYCGRVDIGVFADRDLVPDAQRVADWMAEDLAKLLRAARRRVAR